MIIQTVHKSQFIDEFKNWGTYSNHFSYGGLELLYDYLDDMDAQGPIELDVVAICCEYTEADIDNIKQDYSDALDADADFDDVMKFLEDNTCVVGVSKSKNIVYQQF
jgi:hypothetical protein